MNDMVILAVLVGITLFVVFLINNHSSLPKEVKNPVETNTKRLQDVIKNNELKGITHISYDKRSVAIVNEDKQELYIFNYEQQADFKKLLNYNYKSIPFNKILSSEVIIDNQSISQTMRGSQLAGALVGGALTGGIGAIIGGLSGKTKQIDKVKNIDIKLTIKDLQNPIEKINFINPKHTTHDWEYNKGRSKDDELVKQALKDVEKWQGMFDVILKQQDELNKQSAQ